MPKFSGFISETSNSSNSSGSKISPLPEVFCLPPSRHKFKSEPSFAQSPCNPSRLKGSSNNLFNPYSIPAASVLPPARPAATGIFFSMKTLILCAGSFVSSKNNRHALCTRFFSLYGISSLVPLRIISVLSFFSTEIVR